MTATLATVDGITREQAAENYLKALSQLTVYMFAGIEIELWQRPAHMAFLYARKLVPTPEAMSVVAAFQAREHCLRSPPMVRTIELVGS